MKEYQYYNQFYLSKELSKAISYIISQKEGTDYICRTIVVTIPEHKGEVFISPLNNYNAWGGGLNALSGAQRRVIDEKYGRYVEGTIAEENYPYLVVMDKDSFKRFSKLSFKSKNKIKKALDTLSTFCFEYDEYDGLIFDSRILSAKFPYLQAIFELLDKWRAETGRVTVDDDILKISINEVLKNNEQKPKQKQKNKKKAHSE